MLPTYDTSSVAANCALQIEGVSLLVVEIFKNLLRACRLWQSRDRTGGTADVRVHTLLAAMLTQALSATRMYYYVVKQRNSRLLLSAL